MCMINSQKSEKWSLVSNLEKWKENFQCMSNICWDFQRIVLQRAWSLNLLKIYLLNCLRVNSFILILFRNRLMKTCISRCWCSSTMASRELNNVKICFFTQNQSRFSLLLTLLATNRSCIKVLMNGSPDCLVLF